MTLQDLTTPDGFLRSDFEALFKQLPPALQDRIETSFGKTLGQKVYNIMHSIMGQPKCPSCGTELRYQSFSRGYLKRCPSCKEGGKQQSSLNDPKSFEGMPEPEWLKGIDKDHPKAIEKTVNADGSQSSTILCLASDTSEEALLSLHNYDPNKWEIVSSKHSIWDQFSKAAGLRELYSSKIAVRPRTGYEWSTENIDRAVKQLYGIDKQVPEVISYIPEMGDEEILVIPLCDVHFGLLASPLVTGNTYNMSICETRVLKAVNDAIARSGRVARSFTQILLVLGNDFYNADNLVGTTSHGTPQDQEANWVEVIDRSLVLLFKIIEMLRRYGVTLKVMHVKSNHDEQTMYGTMRTIEARYHDAKDVVVDYSALPRKYIKFGKCLLGFAHDAKIAEVPKIMSVEAREDWSATTFHTFFLAHLHREIVTEDNYGVDIRRLPTLSGWSKWSADQGYVGSSCKTQAFIFHNKKGLTDILNISLD